MKFFKLDGTTQDTFSIGTGKSKVEFQSFSGRLYYRNFGKAWIELKDSDNILQEWEPRRVYSIGQLFTYSNSVWYVKQSHTSGDFFAVASNLVAKVAEYSALTVFDITLADTFILTNSDSLKVIFEGTVDLATSPPKKVILPDALSMERGNRIEIQNDTNINVDVFLHDQIETLDPVRSNGLSFLILKNRVSQNGEWTTFDIGSGADILKFTTTKLGNYLAEKNQIVPVSTAIVNSFTITLPPEPFDSERVALIDVGYNLANRPVFLDRNGRKINNLEEDWIIDVDGIYIEVIYNEDLDSWFFVDSPVAGFSGSSTGGSSTVTPAVFDFVAGPTVVDVAHNRMYYPIIQILDSIGERVEANWRHLDTNIIRIFLDTPQTIKVLLL